MSKPNFAGSILCVIAFLTVPINHATAGTVCTGFFSTVPAVCGNANVQGSSANNAPVVVLTQSTSQGLHQVNGTAVGVDSTGTGSGIGGSVQGTGTFGDAHLFASAFTDFSSSSSTSHVSSVGAIGFVDGFTLPSSTEIKFTSSGSGAFTNSSPGTILGAATGSITFNLVQGAANFVINNDVIFLFENKFSETRTYDLTLPAGDYLFNWSMEADAGAGNNPGQLASSSADLSHTGTLLIDVLTSNASLTFLSGHNYSSAAASATPLPAALPLFAGGLGVIGLLARRRKRKASAALAAT
jgi:hypothetical protein